MSRNPFAPRKEINNKKQKSRLKVNNKNFSMKKDEEGETQKNYPTEVQFAKMLKTGTPILLEASEIQLNEKQESKNSRVHRISSTSNSLLDLDTMLTTTASSEDGIPKNSRNGEDKNNLLKYLEFKRNNEITDTQQFDSFEHQLLQSQESSSKGIEPQLTETFRSSKSSVQPFGEPLYLYVFYIHSLAVCEPALEGFQFSFRLNWTIDSGCVSTTLLQFEGSLNHHVDVDWFSYLESSYSSTVHNKKQLCLTLTYNNADEILALGSYHLHDFNASDVFRKLTLPLLTTSGAFARLFVAAQPRWVLLGKELFERKIDSRATPVANWLDVDSDHQSRYLEQFVAFELRRPEENSSTFDPNLFNSSQLSLHRISESIEEDLNESRASVMSRRGNSLAQNKDLKNIDRKQLKIEKPALGLLQGGETEEPQQEVPNEVRGNNYLMKDNRTGQLSLPIDSLPQPDASPYTEKQKENLLPDDSDIFSSYHLPKEHIEDQIILNKQGSCLLAAPAISNDNTTLSVEFEDISSGRHLKQYRSDQNLQQQDDFQQLGSKKPVSSISQKDLSAPGEADLLENKEIRYLPELAPNNLHLFECTEFQQNKEQPRQLNDKKSSSLNDPLLSSLMGVYEELQKSVLPTSNQIDNSAVLIPNQEKTIEISLLKKALHFSITLCQRLSLHANAEAYLPILRQLAKEIDCLDGTALSQSTISDVDSNHLGSRSNDFFTTGGTTAINVEKEQTERDQESDKFCTKDFHMESGESNEVKKIHLAEHQGRLIDGETSQNASLEPGLLQKVRNAKTTDDNRNTARVVGSHLEKRKTCNLYPTYTTNRSRKEMLLEAKNQKRESEVLLQEVKETFLNQKDRKAMIKQEEFFEVEKNDVEGIWPDIKDLVRLQSLESSSTHQNDLDVKKRNWLNHERNEFHEMPSHCDTNAFSDSDDSNKTSSEEFEPTQRQDSIVSSNDEEIDAETYSPQKKQSLLRLPVRSVSLEIERDQELSRPHVTSALSSHSMTSNLSLTSNASFFNASLKEPARAQLPATCPSPMRGFSKTSVPSFHLPHVLRPTVSNCKSNSCSHRPSESSELSHPAVGITASVSFSYHHRYSSYLPYHHNEALKSPPPLPDGCRPAPPLPRRRKIATSLSGLEAVRPPLIPRLLSHNDEDLAVIGNSVTSSKTVHSINASEDHNNSE